MADIDLLRQLFLKRLTIDSKTNDRRRKDFNQAIDIVLDKFDLAVRDYKEILKPKKAGNKVTVNCGWRNCKYYVDGICINSKITLIACEDDVGYEYLDCQMFEGRREKNGG